MQFNVTYTSNVTSQSAAFQAQFKGAVNAALAYFTHAFTDNITGNLTFDYKSLGSGIAAQNTFGLTVYNSYSSVVSDLAGHARSADDAAALSILPASDPTGSGHLYDF